MQLRRLAILAGATGCSIPFGVFCLTPDGSGFLQPIDDVVHAACSPAAHVPTWLTQTTTSGWPWITIIVAVVVGSAWEAGTAAISWRPMVAAGAAAFTCWEVAAIVRRPAPGHLGDLAVGGDAAYPSLAAAVSVLAAIALLPTVVGRRQRRGRTAAVITAVLLVPAAARLATGSSWLTDELVGSGIGLGWWWATSLAPSDHDVLASGGCEVGDRPPQACCARGRSWPPHRRPAPTSCCCEHRATPRSINARSNGCAITDSAPWSIEVRPGGCGVTSPRVTPRSMPCPPRRSSPAGRSTHSSSLRRSPDP